MFCRQDQTHDAEGSTSFLVCTQLFPTHCRTASAISSNAETMFWPTATPMQAAGACPAVMVWAAG